MRSYFVHLDAIAITVRTGDAVETLTFRSKKAADKKLLELIAAGYKFDRFGWAAQEEAEDDEIVPTNDAEDRYNRT